MDDSVAVCLTCNPDVVESWLYADITDDEISLPNYYIVRLDRNCHGGGIVMYILSGPSDLELIFVSIFPRTSSNKVPFIDCHPLLCVFLTHFYVLFSLHITLKKLLVTLM